ncbi:hypothetical protein [Natrinema pallidum]|uniref:Uncharacterized protein n=1 Tax=Natrinema pallidum DSM 3751 TaxID=1227495 RepID=L9YH65_9EURY|nr:hypothetical protein [Natrinema pallidum]ELY72308.1 hypothetical protein C487_19033 [Natrinema pallidum DSM 3751]
MERTVQEVTPGELCDAVDPCEVTLVLGAPSVGKSHHLRQVGPSVERLEETTAIDADELVIVDNFVSAILHSGDGDRENLNALFARPKGAVLVTRPRSLGWLCRRGHLASAAFLERVYGEALAIVGRTRSTEPNTDEWLAVVTDRLDATATQELPDSPSAFVAGVFTRAYVHAVEDEADAWRRRLDSKLRAYATGAHVEDPAAFLEEVYADIVVAGTTTGQPAAEVEACVAAVYQSIEIASETTILRADDPAVGTFSRVANTLATENPRAQADHTYLFGQALRAVGGAELERAVFDAADGDSPLDDAGRDN